MKEAIIRHFKKWLQDGTGCRFASILARTGRIAYEAHDEMPLALELDRSFDDYAARGLTAVVLLPFVMNEEGLVEVLSSLQADSERWKIRDRSIRGDGCSMVGIEWSTAGGDISDAMGFAPLPSMPVPRRAPYFAIATWPGGRANPERGIAPTPRARTNHVSFLDANHGYDHEGYVTLWSETETAVADLMALPADNAGLYRNVAFVLSNPVLQGFVFSR